MLFRSLTTKKPSINLLFTGNIVGNANLTLSSEGTNFLEIKANVGADSVTLGTHTVGEYVKSISGSGVITVSSGTGEGSTPSVSHGGTGGTSIASTNTNGTVIQSLSVSLDAFGHATSTSVGTTDLDTRYLRLAGPGGATTQTVTGNVLFSGNVTYLGNVVTISANNLIVKDNFIYLNDGDSTNHVDFGFTGDYYDGSTNRRAGFFRDATDNTWKVFEN